MSAEGASPNEGVQATRWPKYAAAVVGFAWFLQIGGGATLDPRNFRWLLAGDWLQHWMGWLFFRQEPWHFPLGRIAGLLYPVGTNIGFTDSNPLVSLMLEPFSGFLPKYFQFIGPWLASCFALQGYAGAALTSVVTKRRWQQFLGGCLFVLSPVLSARLGHDTLCAHWLILGLLYLGLRECPDAAAARRCSRLAAGATALSASIHPYLAAMCWVLAHALYLRLWRLQRVTLVRALGTSAATTAGMLAILGAIGYLGAEGLSSSGFGIYSSNVLTLLAPMGHSRLLPAVDVPPVQWEGFGYLGAGGIALCVLAAAVFVGRRSPSRARTWPVLAACLVMAAYAVSTVVMVGAREVLRIELPTSFDTPFRSSGRFIWSFHYLSLLFGIWGLTRAFGATRQGIATACLAGAVVLQAADLQVDRHWRDAKPFEPAAVYDLRAAVGHYRHVALVPTRVLGVCGGDYDEDLAYRYMYLAYRLDATYNSGIYARLPAAQVRRACLEQEQATERGELDSQTLYVVAPYALPRFDRAGAACGQFRDDWICVSRDSHEAFRQYILASGRRPPVR